MAEPLLELRHIDTFYGPAQVHFDLGLAVNPGEIVALLGGNASGKSTTMKVILGLVAPKAGEVLWEGRSWARTPTPDRIAAGLGSVPESRRLFGAMTVGENLTMGAYLNRDRRQVARLLDEVLEDFPLLKERLGQKAGTLSGGEQQMVALARALMGRPRLVVMDEPTMGLSPLWVEKIWTLVTGQRAKGTAFFLVEQNAHLALDLADRGYVLQTGRVVLEGPAADLRNDSRIRDAYLGSEVMGEI